MVFARFAEGTVAVPLRMLADGYAVGEPLAAPPAVGDLVWLSERKPSLSWIGRLFGRTRLGFTFALVHSRPVPRPSGRVAIETEDGRWMFADVAALRSATSPLDTIAEDLKRGTT